jgi:hypothetical protein
MKTFIGKVAVNNFSRDCSSYILPLKVNYSAVNADPRSRRDFDAENGMVLTEYTLEACNEAGSAIGADVTTA